MRQGKHFRFRHRGNIRHIRLASLTKITYIVIMIRIKYNLMDLFSTYHSSKSPLKGAIISM